VQLPPASRLHLTTGKIAQTHTPQTYWRPRASERRIGLHDAVDELSARLQSAVTAQLVSDVPVGAFLSGGLDSASVVAAMANSGAAVRSFSLGFRESGFDETADAAHTARSIGAQHHSELVDLDLLATIDDIASTKPSCRLATSAPSDCSSWVMVWISDSRGALVSVSGSSVSKVAGINVRQAFLAPAIGITPFNAPLPLTRIESIRLASLVLVIAA
jgi:hypothetical protein